MTTRRGLLTGIAGFLAAPAIVRASSIMPVKVVEPIRPVPLSVIPADLTRYRDEFIEAYRVNERFLRAYTETVDVVTGRFERVS